MRTIPFKSLPPIFQQGADVQPKVLGSAARGQQHFADTPSAGFWVVFKHHLNAVTWPRKRGLQFFRQAAHDGGIFIHPHLFECPFQTQDSNQAAVIGHQYAPVYRFQLAVAAHRAVKSFG